MNKERSGWWEQKLSLLDAFLYGPKVNVAIKLLGLPMDSGLEEFLNKAKKLGKEVMGVPVTFDPIETPGGESVDFGFLVKDGIDFAVIAFKFHPDPQSSTLAGNRGGEYRKFYIKHNGDQIQKMKFKLEVPR